MSKPIHTSAPGKLMIMGEHAVLHNYWAIVAAVDQAIHIRLTPTPESNLIGIDSDLGHHETTIEQLTITKPFQFVLTALQHYQNQLPCGCHIDIQADFSDQVGFGSSAAVTAAMVKALDQWLKIQREEIDQFKQAKCIMQQAQGGVGSGADLAAALFGGILAFKAEPLTIQPLPHIPPIVVLNSGYKTPTTEVIQKVQQHFSDKPQQLDACYKAMDQATQQAISAIQKADWPTLGRCCQQGQQVMRQLHISDATLERLINQLEAEPTISGAKISGSGLGDCVIGIGQLETPLPEQIEVNIDGR